MGFYQCPLLVKNTPLFRSKPEVLIRPRLPIAVRAIRLREARLISLVRAKEYCGKAKFKLNGNHFEVTAAARKTPSRTLSALIANFGSIAKGKHIQIDREFEQEELEVLKISFYDRPISSLTDEEKCRPVLEVNLRSMFFWKHLELSWLGSNQKGMGSKGLVAAYNAVRDIGRKKLQLIVSQDNTNARRFYYHMDFGRPLANHRVTWEVDVI